MEYKLRLAPEAFEDAEAAYAWIARDSPLRAARWYVGLFEAIETLKTNPERCALAPESIAFHEAVRQLLYGKRRNIYRVLFTVRRNTVHILRIRHGSQRLLEPE